MRRRLLTAMLLVAALAVIGFGLPLALSVQRLYRDEALLMLAEEAAVAAAAVPASFAVENDLPELPAAPADVAVALYGVDGRRVLGSGPDVADATVRGALDGREVQRRSSELVVAVPISDEETRVGAIRASLPASVVTERTRRTWAIMAGWAGVVLLAAALLAAERSRSIARPLLVLRADAEMIGHGGELPPRSVSGVVEIDAVHAALTEGATRLNEALARERSFGADLAHQLRTPLASIRLRLETEQVQSDGDPRFLEDALADVERLEQTLADVLTLARDGGPVREPIFIAAVIREAAASWEPRVARTGRTFTCVIEPDLPAVSVSSAAIRQILDVLLDNAVRHGGGEVGLAGKRVGSGVVLAVADHGRTVLHGDDVFVRRHPESVGTGIGLALARRLAEAEGMRLVLADAGPGAAFHLVIGGRRP